MAWHLGRGDQIICDGACSVSKVPGFTPCPVDHDNEPFNDVDINDGSPYFMCHTCDWYRPDTYGENKYETAGMITCPDCQNGENEATYDGPCEEGCNRRGVGAVHRDLPADLTVALTRKYGRRPYRTSAYACAQCFHKMCKRWRHDLAPEIRAEEEHLAWLLHNEQFPPGTCTICRKIRNLQVIDHENADYICTDCYPDWAASRAQPEPQPQLADQPAAGWYSDPDHPEGYLRWWSGTEWVGEPTLTEHILNQ